MKRIKTFQRSPLAHWVACALAVVSVAGVVHAAPLAGEKIKNLATVSYEDENGNKYTAQSNEAVITVAPQYKATIENDRTQNAAPGQTVYFSHTIENTGNVADTYNLTTTNKDAKIYLDTNGNGQPDSGENVITSLGLAPDETANVIVAYSVPVTAANGPLPRIDLIATSAKNGIVDDLAAGNGADGAEGTSSDTINVTTGPVLVLTKSSVIDTTNKTIMYTLTVKNTGRSNATDVDILDVIPFVDTNGDGTKETQMSLVAGSIVTNGLQDSIDIQGADTTENALGWDVNLDGSTDATTMVIKATDGVLSPDTTVSVSYKVSYLDSWAADADIDNSFMAFEDTGGNDQPADPTNPPVSNTTHDDVPQNYAVQAEDDGVGIKSLGVNDGKDDDGTANSDTQFVDTIASGDTVIFTHTLINKGNGDDIFNLSVANTDFPTGTVFTLWNADGTVQLTDSDADGIPDSGVLGQNELTTIVIKADLPAGASGSPAGGYNAVLTATSSADDAVKDTTNLKLGVITAPAVDLAASTDGTKPVNAAAQAILGFNDDGSENAHNEGPVMLKSADVGATVKFPLSVANESGSADSFLLSTEDVPAGWNVVFEDANGNTVTSTPFLPAGATFDYVAVVTVSSDATQALGNSDRSTDVDGHDTVNDGLTSLTDFDGDKDYVIKFKVTSSVDSGRSDEISHAIDVNDIKAVTITPDGQNQVQPGGTVEYPHTLKNDGNVDEAVELIPTNTDSDWGSTTLIDTTGNGVGDTELANLKVGDIIKVYNPDGTTSDVTLTDSDTDNKVEFPLEPGQYVKLINKVFAPADAPQGEVNTTTLSVTDPDVGGIAGTVRNIAEDNSNVILGQVRLTKTVAVDANCDKTPEGAFAEIQATKIEPGQCAVWEIFAKNEGDAKVKNVIITDVVPTYTSLIDDSLIIDGVSKTKKTGDDEAEVSNSGVITYYLGTGANAANQVGGVLLSGASSTVRFTVKIDE